MPQGSVGFQRIEFLSCRKTLFLDRPEKMPGMEIRQVVRHGQGSHLQLQHRYRHEGFHQNSRGTWPAHAYRFQMRKHISLPHFGMLIEIRQRRQKDQ